jgi:hypothetical protein
VLSPGLLEEFGDGGDERFRGGGEVGGVGLYLQCETSASVEEGQLSTSDVMINGPDPGKLDNARQGSLEPRGPGNWGRDTYPHNNRNRRSPWGLGRRRQRRRRILL